jgi:hypothetical protein
MDKVIYTANNTHDIDNILTISQKEALSDSWYFRFYTIKYINNLTFKLLSMCI